jgi:hypothetical protein
MKAPFKVGQGLEGVAKLRKGNRHFRIVKSLMS